MTDIERNDQSLNDNTDYRESEKKTKKKGCFFWGCATFLLLAFITGICLFFVYKKINSTVNEFTSATPVEIASVKYTREERDIANKKVTAFVDIIKKGESVAQEEFTDRELNIYIDSHEKLKNKLKLDFSGDKIKSALNIPLNEIPMMNGRYLVGDAVLKVDCENGDLNIKIESLNVNAKQLPDSLLQAIKNMNFAKNFYDNPTSRPIAKRIKTIEMRDHKLFIEVNPEK